MVSFSTKTGRSALPSTGEVVSALRAFPPEVEFLDYTPGLPHTTLVKIKNLGKHALNVRIKGPSTSVFTVKCTPAIPVKLALGLEMTIEVTFTATSMDNFHDRIIVATEAEALEIPIHALLPAPRLVVTGNFSLGIVPVDVPIRRSFKIQNVGRKPANILIVPERSLAHAKFSFGNKIIDPDRSETLEFSWTPTDLGDFRSQVEIRVQEDPAAPATATHAPQIFAVSALVVQPTLQILDTRGQAMKKVEFDAIYYGESEAVWFDLLNSNPHELRWDSAVVAASGMAAGEDADGESHVPGRQSVVPFIIHPPTGVIDPFGKLRVHVDFRPHADSATKGFLTTMSEDAGDLREAKEFALAVRIATTSAPRTEHTIPLVGRAFKPLIQIDNPEMHFGSVASYSYADTLVKLSNPGALPITARLPSSAYFHCDHKEVVIQPGTTATVVYTYMPRALGHHREAHEVVVCGAGGAEILRRNLVMEGRCNKVGKPVLLGGPDKIPDDFTRPRQFVGEMTTVKRVEEERAVSPSVAPSSPNRSPPRHHRASVDVFLLEDAKEANATLLDPSMTYTDWERTKVKGNKAKYVSYIRESHAQRMQRAQVVKPEAEGDLGLDSYGGMKAPVYPLPDMRQPLVLLDRNQLVARPRNRQPLTAAELGQLERFRHKPRAETDKERNEVRQPLNGPDLAKIQAYRDVEFGQIPPNTEIHRHFVVSNYLGTTLLVRLIAEEYPELKGSGPQLQQVLPTENTAVFDIKLTAKELGRYERLVTYTINGLPMKVRLTADVVPRRLNASSERLTFQFAPTYWDPTIEQTLLVENPIPVAAPFTCLMTNAAFEVIPNEGVVPGRGSLELRVRWTPLYDGALSAADSLRGGLLFNIPGALEPKRIELIGDYPLGTVVPRDKSVDMGAISVGVPASRILSLKNSTEQEAHFRIQPNPTITVSPSMARVAAGTSIDVEVGLEAHQAMTISTHLIIDTRGSSRPLKIPLKANAVLPSITIKEDVLDFGSIYVGGAEKREITFTNGAAVSGRAVIDLRGLSEISLELPNASWQGKDAKDFDGCPITVRTPVMDRAQSTYNRRKSTNTGEASSIVFKGGADYTIAVPPEKSLRLLVVYRPQRAGKLDITLPIEAAGLAEDKEVHLTAIANESLIKIIPADVDFGKRFINKTARKAEPIHMEVSLINNVDSVLNFRFGQPRGGASTALTLSHMDGTIPARGTLSVHAIFLPVEEGEVESSFPLYVGDHDEEYSIITVRGEGAMPRLKFDTRELVLCPVPLGFTSTGVLHVINEGYDNLELRAKLPADQQRIPLTLTFPEGPMIGVAKEVVPVLLSFAAVRPTSFTAKIELSDATGRSFNVPITGTADGCMLTVEPFLAANRDALEFRQDHPPDSSVYLVSKPYTIPHPNPGTNALFATLGPIQSSPSIIRYFQVAAGMRNLSNDAFFDMVVSSKGGLVIEMLERWSGKTMPGKVHTFAHNRKDAAEQALGQYDRMLTLLKSNGALINAIKPEYLLEYEDLRRLVESRVAKAQTQADEETARLWERVESNFKEVSRRSWNAVLLQLFKVFVLARVTPKALRGMPGMEGLTEVSEKALSVSSNIYSTAEHLLLWWLSEHFKRVFPDVYERVKSFDTDVQDCLSVFAALAVHLPDTTKYLPRLARPAKDAAGKLQNAAVVVEVLNALQLPFVPTPQELATGTAVDWVVFTMYLFNTLPQLLPKTTIEFTGKLGERQTKYLELRNPSSKPVTYTAKLEGHSDFYLPGDQVRVEPEQVVNFPVACKPTITKATEGLLMLVPMQDSSAVGGFLTFTLRSSVPVTQALATIDMEGKMYELKTVPLEIRNPFPADCDLTVTLQNAFIEAVNERPVESEKKDKGPARKDGEKKSIKLPSQSSLVNQMAKRYPLAFGMERARIKLKQGATETLQIFFLPFSPVTYTCRLVLEDPTQGALVYDLRGQALPPDPSLRLTVPLELKEGINTITKDIQVPWTNNQLEAAKRAYLEKHPLARDKAYGPVVRQLLDPKQKVEQLDYLVDSRNQRVAVPKLYALKQHGREHQEPLVLTLQQEGPGRYYTRVTMHSTTDFRVLEFTLDCTSSPASLALDFMGPSRQMMQQDIPLINNFDKPLQIRAVVQGEGFSGPQSITLDPEASGVYPLSFRAPWMGDYKGKLELHIPATGEATNFTLAATADEPIAEGHIALECSARTVTTCMIKVPNIMGAKDCNYTVFSDLPAVRGDSSLAVRGRSTADYKVLIRPQRSGTLVGSITFSAPNQMYVWYTVELKVSAPAPVDQVDIGCEIRKAVSLQIPLVNPLDREVDMDVRFQGRGLLGKQKIHLSPRESSQYSVFYSPLVEGSEEGRVYFSSEQVGEQWYKLRLSATQPRPTQLEDLDCELGRTAPRVIQIQNPLPETAVFKAATSNGRVYSIYPSVLEVEPFGQAEFRLDFSPASLGDAESAFVTISDPSAGRWEYEASGHGVAPTGLMDEIKLVAAVGSSSSTMIIWKNPLAAPQNVALSLLHGGESFQLLFKRPSNVTVGPLQALQIPISFAPKSLDEMEAEVRVTMESPRNPGQQQQQDPAGTSAALPPLVWRYKLRGLAEAHMASSAFSFTCKARERLEQPLDIILAGLSRIGEGEVFSYEVLPRKPDEARLIAASFRVEEVAAQPRDPTQPLRYRAIFMPRRSFRTTADFIILKSGGGRWRFELALHASEPDLDGVLSIEATVGSVTSIPVPVRNDSLEPVPYRAYFTPTSSLDLDVRPREGILPPDNEEPELSVSFAAKTYGRPSVGVLVVQTATDQWSWEVRGTQPKYARPDKSKMVAQFADLSGASRTASVGPGGQSPPKSRNFLQENLRLAQSQKKK